MNSNILIPLFTGKGFHPGHNMMRIATPETIWPKHFFNRLNKMNDRLNKMHERATKEKEAKEAKDEAKKETGDDSNNSSENSNSGSWNMGGGRCGGFGQGWGQGWGPRNPREPCGFGTRSRKPFGFDPETFKHMESQLNANGNLMDLGNMVRAALDPFGVDVHVDIETPNGEKKCMNKKKSCAEKSAEKQAEKSAEQAEKSAEQVEMQAEQAEKSTEQVEKQAEQAEKPSEQAEKPADEAEKQAEMFLAEHVKKHFEQHFEKLAEQTEKPAEQAEQAEQAKAKTPESPEEEWTVLDKAGSPEPKKAQAEALYPQLEERKEPMDLSGLTPKVQVALLAMENMGFTNDGGWLSNLLTKYDGDIGKVLDLLSPAKPVRN